MIKEDIIAEKDSVLEEIKADAQLPKHISRSMRRKFVQKFGLPTFSKQFEAYTRTKQK